MHHPPDIISLAFKQHLMQHELELVQEKEQMIPGSVQYVIQRYHRNSLWNIEDAGMLVYHYEKHTADQNFLELRFCITGNVYCRETETGCEKCSQKQTGKCNNQLDTVDVVSLKFAPAQLSQFVKPRKMPGAVSEDILNFTHHSSFSKVLPICGKTRSVLEGLLNHTYTDSLANIFINGQTQMLLLYSLDCMVGDKGPDVITCKFLANDADREKIVRAREILIQQIGEPITIKELSRKVAMNECYLKKGFKEMFGTTIFEFYQSQRMEHAKYLLYEKGLSVTDVSHLLGYSSISHFSTAFKKHTGLKPCELLFR